MQGPRCACEPARSIIVGFVWLATNVRKRCLAGYTISGLGRLFGFPIRLQAVSAGGNFMRGYQALKCARLSCLPPCCQVKQAETICSGRVLYVMLNGT